MTDGVITIVARDTDDGTSISAVVGEPLNKTYTGQVQSGQILLLVPAADLVSALSTTPLTTYTLDNGAGDPDVVSERFKIVVSDYSVLDVDAAVAGFEVREYVNGDPMDTSGALVTSITPNEQYVIRALWQDSDGAYAGGTSSELIFMDVDLGTEAFTARDGTTNYNLYLYTAPATNETLQDATFTYSRYDDLFLSTSKDVAVGVPVTVLASTGLATPIILGPSTIALGSWAQQDWVDLFGSSTAYTPTNMEHLSLIDDGGVFKIRQQHVAASTGSERVIAPFNIAESSLIKIKQTIKLDANYTWGTTSFSGKLGFGIGGGANTAGGATNPAGFTLRPSWDEGGEFALYSYAANRDNAGNADFGEEIQTGFFMTPDVPFTIEIWAQINSAFNINDGWVRLWIDGVEIVSFLSGGVASSSLTGIGWQTQPFGSETTPHFDRVQWSEFHGGANSNWSPTSTTGAEVYDISYELS